MELEIPLPLHTIKQSHLVKKYLFTYRKHIIYIILYYIITSFLYLNHRWHITAATSVWRLLIINIEQMDRKYEAKSGITYYTRGHLSKK